MDLPTLLQKYPLVSDQIELDELSVLLSELEKVLAADIRGDVVEFGCYVGTASLFMQRLIAGSNKRLHVYDSFEGLPQKSDRDQSPAGKQFAQGELAASKDKLIKNFKQANLPLPVIHKGWFDRIRPSDIPEQIAFAFLDGDFYQSVMDSLKLIWPRLSPGAVVIVDDYQSESLPGARRAVDAWLTRHPVPLRVQSSLAIIKIPKS